MMKRPMWEDLILRVVGVVSITSLAELRLLHVSSSGRQEASCANDTYSVLCQSASVVWPCPRPMASDR